MQKPKDYKIRPSKIPENFQKVKKDLEKLGLNTVCQESHCPNISDCWSDYTATFLAMGDICTRGCNFCAIKTGIPKKLDELEPSKIAFACKKMGLKYVVITSVDRDELEDQGANHLAKTIKTIKKINPEIKIEILIPDFQGRKELIDIVLEAEPTVIAHNIETIERLTPTTRDIRASYKQSLEVLDYIISKNQKNIIKTSLMCGLGEKKEEIEKTFDDLKKINLDILTIGQYLKPKNKFMKVHQYLTKKDYQNLENLGKEKIPLVIAGPFIRSSYKAEHYYNKLKKILSI
ncbi:lipoyl synthase [bacterium]|nr:lipoyl synthase [bacterium]